MGILFEVWGVGIGNGSMVLYLVSDESKYVFWFGFPGFQMNGNGLEEEDMKDPNIYTYIYIYF